MMTSSLESATDDSARRAARDFDMLLSTTVSCWCWALTAAAFSFGAVVRSRVTIRLSRFRDRVAALSMLLRRCSPGDEITAGTRASSSAALPAVCSFCPCMSAARPARDARPREERAASWGLGNTPIAPSEDSREESSVATIRSRPAMVLSAGTRTVRPVLATWTETRAKARSSVPPTAATRSARRRDGRSEITFAMTFH
mmetsp:Transcript_22387/g.51634  ORF Transcript_22387/g.51634 Transcript_22387/m.51634 type:complete len:200 (+) Transcript_22387:1544-2143(+)